jgi:D-amino-acid dehydrogenase
MLKVIKGLFPDGADYSQAEYWAGLRPMTPQERRSLARANSGNLWLNTGQGIWAGP